MTFRLPPDPKDNADILKASELRHTKLHLGCAKWGRPEWVGKLYPRGVTEKEFLRYYGQHYDSIELNATHYQVYDKDAIKGWVKKIDNPDFKFCPKAHRSMSFLRQVATRDSVTKAFLKNIRYFGDNLGPIFITHNEKLKWTEEAEADFFSWLESLPRDLTFFIEERSLDFFQNNELIGRYYAKLRELGMGVIITDAAGRPDVCHMHLTIPKTIIRFVGNSLHPSDFPRVDHWGGRIKKWMGAGIKEVYFFMHMHDEGLSPELTQYVVKQFNKKMGLKIPEVTFVQ